MKNFATKKTNFKKEKKNGKESRFLRNFQNMLREKLKRSIRNLGFSRLLSILAIFIFVFSMILYWVGGYETINGVKGIKSKSWGQLVILSMHGDCGNRI
jgi:ABC-type bacteriocin/lantibiotic exporter with double-glycine peptidase domain